RGVPKKVRYCVDFPGEVTDEYYTIYRDAGWEMVCSALGWHIWRTEYSGGRRRELFSGVEPVFQGNNNLVVGMAVGHLAWVGVFGGGPGRWLVSTTAGRIVLVPYVLLMVGLAAAAGAALAHNRRLKARKR